MTMRNKFINKIEKDINLKKTLNLILNEDYKILKLFFQIMVQQMKQVNY